MDKENILSTISEIQETLKHKSNSVSSVESELDDLDVSSAIGDLRNQLEQIASDIDEVTETLETLSTSVSEIDIDANDEHREVHHRLQRNANDVMNLLAEITKRVNTVQARGFEYSSFHYDYTTSDTEKKLADGLYRLYWLLIDVSGYSDEQFQDKLMFNEIDYKVKELEVKETTNV
jgi:chromosome segregation ATPase